jgi:hypothetical protein
MFAPHLAQDWHANVRSKSAAGINILLVVLSILTFAKAHPRTGCECQNCTTIMRGFAQIITNRWVSRADSATYLC